ncbi:hypothetical protein [Halorubrum sp. DTA46]
MPSDRRSDQDGVGDDGDRCRAAAESVVMPARGSDICDGDICGKID